MFLILKVVHCYFEILQKDRNKEYTKYAVLDWVLLNKMIGKSQDPFYIFDGLICDELALLSDAKTRKNIQLIESIHLQRFVLSFWLGNYADADEAYKLAASCSSFQMPKIHFLFHTFYRGLISFQMYRDGEGEEWFEEGKTVLNKFDSWHCNYVSNVENKLLLLRAEYMAATCEINGARAAYEASIKSAQDHGFVHEQGLAYEFMGMFLNSVVETSAALVCFKHAYECYMQWGAIAKADQIRMKYNFDLLKEELNSVTIKRGREHESRLENAC